MTDNDDWATAGAEVGQVTVLVTSNGTHDAKDWATATAMHIFNIEGLQGAARVSAESVRDRIASTLVPIYQRMIDEENAFLESDSSHFIKPLSADDHAKEATQEISRTTCGTPWDSKLNSREWLDHAEFAITAHMQTAQHTERLWFADHNKSQHAMDYKAKFQGNI